MKFSKKHIHPVFNIGILLIGFIFYSTNPMNTLTNHDALAFCLQSNTETLSDSEITDQNREIKSTYIKARTIVCKGLSLAKVHLDNEELPVDEESDQQNGIFELSLKETEENEESSAGMGSLAILKQAVTHSILSFEVPSPDVLSLFKHLNFLPNEYSRLFENRSVLSHNSNPSPLASGIAIHAP